MKNVPVSEWVGVGGGQFVISLPALPLTLYLNQDPGAQQWHNWYQYQTKTWLHFPYLVKSPQTKLYHHPPAHQHTKIIEMIYFVLCIEYFLHSFLTVGLFASFQASSRFPTMFSRVFTSVSRSMLFSLPSLLSSKVILITSFGSHRSSKDLEAKVAWNLQSSFLKWSPGMEKVLVRTALYLAETLLKKLLTWAAVCWCLKILFIIWAASVSLHLLLIKEVRMKMRAVSSLDIPSVRPSSLPLETVSTASTLEQRPTTSSGEMSATSSTVKLPRSCEVMFTAVIIFCHGASGRYCSSMLSLPSPVSTDIYFLRHSLSQI